MTREVITVDGATLYENVPFIPKFARVIIERQEFRSKGGLIIPDDVAKNNSRAEGRVVAVGPTAENVELGETIMFGNFSGVWIKRDEHEYFIVQDDDVLVKIKE